MVIVAVTVTKGEEVGGEVVCLLVSLKEDKSGKVLIVDVLRKANQNESEENRMKNTILEPDNGTLPYDAISDQGGR